MMHFHLSYDCAEQDRLIFQRPRRAPVPQAARKPAVKPKARPKLARRISSKQLLGKMIDRLPPAALGDIKAIMMQAVDLMDRRAIDLAASKYAKRYGIFGAFGAAMTGVEQKKAIIRNMIKDAKTKQDIMGLINYVDRDTFERALTGVLNDPRAVQRFAGNPHNTMIAKRMAGTIINSLHPVARKQALEQIIIEANPHEFHFIKYMIKMQIYKANSKVLDRLTSNTPYRVFVKEFGDVGAPFVYAVFKMGMVPSGTIKNKAIKFVDRLDKNGLLAQVHSMHPNTISSLINLGINSWGFYDTANATRNPAGQRVASGLAMKSAHIVMRAI